MSNAHLIVSKPPMTKPISDQKISKASEILTHTSFDNLLGGFPVNPKQGNEFPGRRPYV